MATDPWDFSNEDPGAPVATPRLSDEAPDGFPDAENVGSRGPPQLPVSRQPKQGRTTDDDFNFADREPGNVQIPRAGFGDRDYIPAAMVRTQQWLGLSVIVILAGTVLGVFIMVGFSSALTPADTRELLTEVLTAVVGITGTVLGFFFGRYHGP